MSWTTEELKFDLRYGRQAFVLSAECRPALSLRAERPGVKLTTIALSGDIPPPPISINGLTFH
jgi:hypothetical protein